MKIKNENYHHRHIKNLALVFIKCNDIERFTTTKVRSSSVVLGKGSFVKKKKTI